MSDVAFASASVRKVISPKREGHAARDEEAFGVVRMSNTDVLLLALANSTNSRTLAAMVPGDKIKV